MNACKDCKYLNSNGWHCDLLDISTNNPDWYCADFFEPKRETTCQERKRTFLILLKEKFVKVLNG